MIKHWRQKLAVAGIVGATYLVNVAPVFAQTQAWTGVCVSEADKDVATIQGFQCLLANVLSIFLTLVGLAGFIALIAASFRILTAGGNSQQMEKSRQSITHAVLGLVVAVSAFIILNLISRFTGVKSILEFNIPGPTTKWPL